MRCCLRGLTVLGLALGGALLAVAPARASCIQQTVTDQIARAEVIAYGQVSSVDRGAGTLSFQALTVYKGDPGPGRITVRVSPGGGGATSVDYRAEPGDHLLYLQRQGSGYATNDCSGSHAGPATAEELRLLATGSLITYPDSGPDPRDGLAGPAVAAVVAAAAAAVVIAVRRARAR